MKSITIYCCFVLVFSCLKVCAEDIDETDKPDPEEEANESKECSQGDNYNI
jgi:hypothetical protein